MLFGLSGLSLADRRVVPLSPQRLNNLKEAYLVTIAGFQYHAIQNRSK